MTQPSVIRSADAATRERLRELAGQPLSREEFPRRLAIPISDEQRRETLDLVRWFTRRYPTPRERLAWARRAYARWLRHR